MSKPLPPGLIDDVQQIGHPAGIAFRERLEFGGEPTPQGEGFRQRDADLGLHDLLEVRAPVADPGGLLNRVLQYRRVVAEEVGHVREVGDGTDQPQELAHLARLEAIDVVDRDHDAAVELDEGGRQVILLRSQRRALRGVLRGRGQPFEHLPEYGRARDGETRKSRGFPTGPR